MKDVIKSGAIGLFAIIVLAVSAAPRIAEAGGSIKVIIGMYTSKVTVTPHADTCTATGGDSYWHCDEGTFPNNVGLDVTNASGATGGTTVAFQAYGSSTGYAYGNPTNHLNWPTSLCPGVDVAIWIPIPDASVGSWIGTTNFVQINPTITMNQSFYISPSGWTIEDLGTVVSGAGQNGCPSDGSHLHQSTSSALYLFEHQAVASDDDSGTAGLQIWSTGSYSTNYVAWINY